MANNQSKSSRFVVQGSILAIASLIVRLIGLGYRIPLINILTDTGNGYYGIAFEIYSFFLVISSYGFPAAISKIVSNRLAQKKYKEAHIIFKSSLVLSVLLGTAFSMFMFFGASAIARFYKVDEAVYAIQALAPALFIFSIMSVIRGYFQGMRTMIPTAFSQIIEQVFNAIFSIVFAILLLDKGFEYAAAGSSLGTATGALAGALFLGLLYLLMRPMIHRRCAKDPHNLEEGSLGYYWKMLLMVSVPIVLGTTTFRLTSVIDTAMFTNALNFYGYNDNQIATMTGILSGKYMILITLPVAIATALGTSAIPSITHSLVKGDGAVLKQKVDFAIRVVLMISIPAAVGLAVMASPVLELLFKQQTHINMTTAMIQIGAVSVVFFSLNSILTALLQGLDLVYVPVKNAVLALVIKVILNMGLLYMMNWNLYGIVLTNIVFAFVSMALNYVVLNRHVHLKLNHYRTLIAPVLASVLMAGVVTITFFLIQMLLPQGIATLLAIMIGALSYGITLLKLGAFTKQELSSLPMGNKLLRWL
jgi:stage V sporulation protein B